MLRKLLAAGGTAIWRAAVLVFDGGEGVVHGGWGLGVRTCTLAVLLLGTLTARQAGMMDGWMDE